MKFSTSISLFGIASLVAASPLPKPYSTTGNAIKIREISGDDSVFYKRSDMYDSALSTRSTKLYEPVQRRALPTGISVSQVQEVLGVARDITQVVLDVKGQVEKDKGKRSEWTKEMVDQFRARKPGFNFVVCHTKHTTDFKGKRDVDWGHIHQELSVSFGKTVGFEIYWFKEGTFHRIGDGGHLNWAYAGNIKNTSMDGKDVTFGAP